MPVRINPHRALRTPRSILNQSGPNPRVVDKEAWAKLLWAAIEPAGGGFTPGEWPADLSAGDGACGSRRVVLCRPALR